jgi:hypothetical protein
VSEIIPTFAAESKHDELMTAAKKADSTLMTRKEFFDRIDKAKAGRTYSMLPDENLTEFLKRQGYDL